MPYGSSFQGRRLSRRGLALRHVTRTQVTETARDGQPGTIGQQMWPWNLPALIALRITTSSLGLAAALS